MCRKVNFLKPINTCDSSIYNTKKLFRKNIFLQFPNNITADWLIIRKIFGFHSHLISDALIVYSFFNSMLKLYLQLAWHDYLEPCESFRNFF